MRKPDIVGSIKAMHSDKILLRRSTDKPETASKDSVILLPDAARHQSQIAEVLAVGPGKTVKGKLVPMELKVGDKVVVGHWSGIGTKIRMNGELLVVLREQDILAKVEEE